MFLKVLGGSSVTDGFWGQLFLSAIVHFDGVRLKTQGLVVLTAVTILTGALQLLLQHCLHLLIVALQLGAEGQLQQHPVVYHNTAPPQGQDFHTLEALNGLVNLLHLTLEGIAEVSVGLGSVVFEVRREFLLHSYLHAHFSVHCVYF